MTVATNLLAGACPALVPDLRRGQLYTDRDRHVSGERQVVIEAIVDGGDGPRAIARTLWPAHPVAHHQQQAIRAHINLLVEVLARRVGAGGVEPRLDP